jgi:hypothetical protein
MSEIQLLVLYALGVFLVGMPISSKSIDVWEKAFLLWSKAGCHHSGGLLGYFLFPLTAWEGQVGCTEQFIDSPFFIPRLVWGRCPGQEKKKSGKKYYILISSLLWPLRVASGIIGVLYLGACLLRGASGKMFTWGKA